MLVVTNNPKQTIELGKKLSRLFMASDVILLEGPLGSGKTTFTKGVLAGLGSKNRVISPSYTLLREYKTRKFMCYHIDLYRISDPEELEFLGWADLNEGLRLIEWPERAPGLRKQGDLLIGLRYDGAGRLAELTGLADQGNELLRRLHEAPTSADS